MGDTTTLGRSDLPLHSLLWRAPRRDRRAGVRHPTL